MAAIFYIIGALGVLIGLAWAALGWFQPYPVNFGPGADIMARALIIVPGLGVIGSGLVFLAIGGVLSRLDRIVENTGSAPRRERGPAFD
jgi:hypothetical protein